MADLETAIGIAVQAHWGQKDRGGAPYILHPLRMMFRVQTEAERMAAVLHDVVEDTDWTLDALREQGFPDEVVTAVDHLTRREDESYDEFVTRAAAHPVARRVKLADLEDNMDVRRTGTLGEGDVERLGRYLRAWRRLTHDLPG
jgi:(p)ppGpp synthase/HD superfamily hydrolase